MKANLLLSCLAVFVLFLAYAERRTFFSPTSAPVAETISTPLFPLAPEAITKLILGKTDDP